MLKTFHICFRWTQNFMPVFQKVSCVQQSVQAFSLNSFSLFPGISPSLHKVSQTYSSKTYQDLQKEKKKKILVQSVSHFSQHHTFLRPTDRISCLIRNSVKKKKKKSESRGSCGPWSHWKSAFGNSTPTYFSFPWTQYYCFHNVKACNTN